MCNEYQLGGSPLDKLSLSEAFGPISKIGPFYFSHEFMKRVIFLISAVLLLVDVSVAAANKESSNKQVAATKGSATVSGVDIDALHFMLSEKKREALKESETEVLKSLDEVLNARHFARDMRKDFRYSEEERRYADMQVERAHLTAALAVVERRARLKFEPDSALTTQRAREVWIKDDQAFFEQAEADITVIQFDLSKRSWSETVARVAEVQAEIKKGTAFDELVNRYSEDPGKATTGGRVRGVLAATSDPPLASVIFNRLALNEISDPVAARRGLYIVRLDAKRDRKKVPFDTVKPQIVADLLEDDARRARVELIQKIESVPINARQEVINALLPKPVPNIMEKIREIHRQVTEGKLPGVPKQ
jgi:PPIC-type PPIASE domain